MAVKALPLGKVIIDFHTVRIKAIIDITDSSSDVVRSLAGGL
jgi:hypothetical protein